jgi:hypothetical protein
VYPWYLVWLAPFLAGRSTVPLAVWTVSIQAVYVVWYRPGGAPWAVPGWALAAEYGAVAVAAAWSLWASRRRDDRTVNLPRAAP